MGVPYKSNGEARGGRQVEPCAHVFCVSLHHSVQQGEIFYVYIVFAERHKIYAVPKLLPNTTI